MSTLTEDLALEEYALGELLAEAEAYWQAGMYRAALDARRDAGWARERIAAMKQEQERTRT